LKYLISRRRVAAHCAAPVVATEAHDRHAIGGAVSRKLFSAAILLAVSHLLTAEALACSCTEYGTPPCAAYWRADAVFTGVVADISELPKDAPNALPMAMLRFLVEDAFRGIKVSEVDVAIPSGTSCDIEFTRGERWLVYGYRDKATGRLEIHPCTRTKRLEFADEDLTYIRGLRRKAPEQSARGKLKWYIDGSRAGLEITVRAGGKSYGAVTDEDGAFVVALPKAGAYTVQAVVPFSAQAMSPGVEVKSEPTDERTILQYNAQIPAGQCSYNELNVYEVDLHATAEVGGRVSDEETGQAVTRGGVYLVDAAPEDGSRLGRRYAKIDNDGSFKFEGVAVGSYHLVINPEDKAPGEEDAPHPRTFYPGADDPARVTPLIIEEGAKLEDIDFRVRPAMKSRTVTGSVVWQDGKAAEQAYVSLYAGAQYVEMVRVDASGNFTLDIYGDFEYQVKSVVVHGRRRGESEKVQVPRGDGPARLTLTLKLIPSKGGEVWRKWTH
jgi:hypothetical protein